jgi:hypothetical protein
MNWIHEHRFSVGHLGKSSGCKANDGCIEYKYEHVIIWDVVEYLRNACFNNTRRFKLFPSRRWRAKLVLFDIIAKSNIAVHALIGSRKSS